MVQKTVVCQFGHLDSMKVIALLIQKASLHKTQLSIARGDRRANAKSLLGMMSLGLQDGMEVTVLAEGNEAEAACAELADWLEHPEL